MTRLSSESAAADDVADAANDAVSIEHCDRATSE